MREDPGGVATTEMKCTTPREGRKKPPPQKNNKKRKAVSDSEEDDNADTTDTEDEEDEDEDEEDEEDDDDEDGEEDGDEEDDEQGYESQQQKENKKRAQTTQQANLANYNQQRIADSERERALAQQKAQQEHRKAHERQLRIRKRAGAPQNEKCTLCTEIYMPALGSDCTWCPVCMANAAPQ